MSLTIVFCCSGKYHIEEERVGYKVSMLLQIRNFGEEDAGVYMCTSTNSLGKIEGSIRLYQIGIQETENQRE
jgi:neurotrimin